MYSTYKYIIILRLFFEEKKHVSINILFNKYAAELKTLQTYYLLPNSLLVPEENTL